MEPNNYRHLSTEQLVALQKERLEAHQASIQELKVLRETIEQRDLEKRDDAREGALLDMLGMAMHGSTQISNDGDEDVVDIFPVLLLKSIRDAGYDVVKL